MRTTRQRLPLPMIALLVVAIFTASAGAVSARSRYPPCTRKALSAGLRRGSAQPRNARFQGSFGCARGWAYSGVVVGRGQHSFDAIAVYRAKNGAWMTIDRAQPCRTHAIPRQIYRGACTTS